MEDELDNGLIEEFEKNDKLYADFYKENVHYINIHLIYVNKNNDIQKIEQESFIMTKPNFISRMELMEILKGGLSHHAQGIICGVFRCNFQSTAHVTRYDLLQIFIVVSVFVVFIKIIH